MLVIQIKISGSNNTRELFALAISWVVLSLEYVNVYNLHGSNVVIS